MARGADVVIECTGQVGVWELAPQLARRGGHVVLFGGCPPSSLVRFDTNRLHYDELSVSSPFHFTPRDVRASYELLSAGAFGGAGSGRGRVSARTARRSARPPAPRRRAEVRHRACRLTGHGAGDVVDAVSPACTTSSTCGSRSSRSPRSARVRRWCARAPAVSAPATWCPGTSARRRRSCSGTSRSARSSRSAKASARFRPGDRVFVHHHAPCFSCRACARGEFVQCPTWKQSQLDPGGMAEYFPRPGDQPRRRYAAPAGYGLGCRRRARRAARLCGEIARSRRRRWPVPRC